MKSYMKFSSGEAVNCSERLKKELNRLKRSNLAGQSHCIEFACYSLSRAGRLPAQLIFGVRVTTRRTNEDLESAMKIVTFISQEFLIFYRETGT